MMSSSKQEKQWRSQRLEVAGMLTGSVAHDFNNLLTMINAHAEAALEEIPAHSEAAKDLNSILQITGKAGALTGQLLSFLRRTPTANKPLNVNHLIEQSTSMYKRLLGDKIKLTMQLGVEVKPVLADVARMEQVLVNLLVNAKEAMPKGGWVRVSTTMADTRLRLQIADNGPGMDEETRARVFEPFFTTREAGGGTGIGLSTVATIINEGGGSIQLETSPGKGAAFTIYWPVIQSL